MHLSKRRLLVALLRLRLVVAERLRPGEEQVTLVWAIVVGALGGLAGLAFTKSLHLMQRLMTQRTGRLGDVATSLEEWQRILVPTAGGLLAGLVLTLGRRLTKGEKPVDYMEAIALGDAQIKTRSTAVRSTAALFAIGSGASIGREGPMVQVSSWIASLAGRRSHFAIPRQRLITACGAAAGIAAAYNAPIAGAIFIAEVVLGSIAIPTFGPLVLSSVISTLVVRAFDHSGPVYDVPSFRPSSVLEVLAYAPLGIVCGAAGVLFMRCLEFVAGVFRRLPAVPTLRLGIGGLVVGVVSVVRPDVWGNGYGVVSSMLVSHWTLTAILAILVAKILATSASFGSGAPGGVFTPTLFVGASVGLMFGQGYRAFTGTDAIPQCFALVGMGCLLAGTTQAPLMAIIMIFELTLDYDLILPLMLGCLAAHYTAQSLGAAPIYRHHLRHRLATPWSVLAAKDVRARDVMRSESPTLLETDGFVRIAEHFLAQRSDQAFIVDGGGHYKGCVTLHDVNKFLHDDVLSPLLTVHDLMHDRLPTVRESTSIAEMLPLFGGMRDELIAVTTAEDQPRLLGCVAKTDVMIALAETRLEI